jgi:hypothetical protein
MSLRRTQFLLLFSLWIGASIASACKLPVFRYALERWSVDRYRMVAIVDNQESDTTQAAVAELQALARSSANVDIEVMDLSSMSEVDLWQLDSFDGDIETPRLQVFFPERNGQPKKCWEGELTLAAVQSWSDSRLRQQIAGDLVSGVSAVWLMVDGLDEEQNQQIAEKVAAALAEASAEIKIPDGVIPRDGANRYLQEHPEASMDDVLRSDVPLKVEFRLRRLRRDNRDESALRAMVGGLAEADGRVVFVPIFGRGRMLDAIVTESVDGQTIVNACRYMVGECSCTVKALNPGVDLILNVDWQQRLGHSVMVMDHSYEAEADSSPTLVPVPTGRADVIEAGPIGKTTNSRFQIFGLILISLIVGLGYAVHRSR